MTKLEYIAEDIHVHEKGYNRGVILALSFVAHDHQTYDEIAEQCIGNKDRIREAFAIAEEVDRGHLARYCQRKGHRLFTKDDVAEYEELDKEPDHDIVINELRVGLKKPKVTKEEK